MKVEYEEEHAKFDDIRIGGCFKTSMSYYMKIEKGYSNEGKAFNAVGLGTGTLFNFDLNNSVIPVNLKAVRAD